MATPLASRVWCLMSAVRICPGGISSTSRGSLRWTQYSTEGVGLPKTWLTRSIIMISAATVRPMRKPATLRGLPGEGGPDALRDQPSRRRCIHQVPSLLPRHGGRQMRLASACSDAAGADAWIVVAGLPDETRPTMTAIAHGYEARWPRTSRVDGMERAVLAEERAWRRRARALVARTHLSGRRVAGPVPHSPYQR